MPVRTIRKWTRGAKRLCPVGAHRNAHYIGQLQNFRFGFTDTSPKDAAIISANCACVSSRCRWEPSVNAIVLSTPMMMLSERFSYTTILATVACTVVYTDGTIRCGKSDCCKNT